MDKEIIHTSQCPDCIGPYSQAVRLGNLIFTSGMLAIHPSTGEFLNGDAAEQAALALQNLKALLECCGSSMDRVVKTTVFLKNMDDFARVNRVYAIFFPQNQPARSCVQVARLPKDALVEIECIAGI